MTHSLRVGIVGYGLMAKTHTYAYRAAPQLRPVPVRFEPVAMSGRDATALARAAADYGIAEYATDWRAIIKRTDVDVVDICTPPGNHAEVACAAAELGKSVLCEKPLAATYADAMAALGAVERMGVHHAVGFNYRHLPAVALLREMVVAGEVGTVRLVRATWLSDEFVDPDVPFDWRFDPTVGGSTIADLGSHLVDLAEWVVGPIREVSAMSSTFTSERSVAGSSRHVAVDDASCVLVRFDSGAQGTMEVAKVVPRRPCDFTVEINGTSGTLLFSYSRLNELWFGDGRDDARLYGMRRIRVEHPQHPETAGWWPIGQGVGYGASFVNQVFSMADAWPERPWQPGFDVGARVAGVCAAMERSAAEHRWVDVAEVVGDGPA